MRATAARSARSARPSSSPASGRTARSGFSFDHLRLAQQQMIADVESLRKIGHDRQPPHAAHVEIHRPRTRRRRSAWLPIAPDGRRGSPPASSLAGGHGRRFPPPPGSGGSDRAADRSSPCGHRPPGLCDIAFRPASTAASPGCDPGEAHKTGSRSATHYPDESKGSRPAESGRRSLRYTTRPPPEKSIRFSLRQGPRDRQPGRRRPLPACHRPGASFARPNARHRRR